MKLACPLAFCPSDLLIISPHSSPLPLEREITVILRERAAPPAKLIFAFLVILSRQAKESSL